MDFTREELDILSAVVRRDAQNLRKLMNDLEARGLHNGDQNVRIQGEASKLEKLYRKLVATGPIS